MNPEEIDLAIEALSDHEHEQLYNAAAQRWSFRAQTWALAFAYFGIAGGSLIPIRVAVRSYWPGSIVATILAMAAWIGILIGVYKLISSECLTGLRIQWAARKEYMFRSDAA